LLPAPPTPGLLVFAVIKHPTILIFDSGLGGLTVFREITKVRPDARFVYVADDAMFPYGALAESVLVARVVELMDGLVATHRPDLVVIACATASTRVLPSLRARWPVAFVGTVPAIKPACAASTSRRISVLATPGTVARDYTKALIRDFAGDCEVTLVGSTQLAGLAEAELAGSPADDAAIVAEIAPCFVGDGDRRTDTVVLACTHYPLLLERFMRLAPWPVRFIDPAPAIAQRVVTLIGPAASRHPPGPAVITFTSGREPGPTLGQTLTRFGLDQADRDLGGRLDERRDVPA